MTDYDEFIVETEKARRERIAVAVLPAIIRAHHDDSMRGRVRDAFTYADLVIAETDSDIDIEALIAGKPVETDKEKTPAGSKHWP